MKVDYRFSNDYENVLKLIITHYIAYHELSELQNPFNLHIRRDNFDIIAKYEYCDLSAENGKDYPILQGEITLSLDKVCEWHNTVQKTIFETYISIKNNRP
jgi:hypothetical protein